MFLFADKLNAQNLGEIRGTVIDSVTKETLIGANVSTEYGGQQFGVAANFNGSFEIKNLRTGSYNVTVSFMGYRSKTYTGIQVLPGSIAYLPVVKLSTDNALLPAILVRDKDPNPLLNKDEPTKMILLAHQIENSPEFRNLGNLVGANRSDIKVSEDGKRMNFRGSREGAEGYYIDGVKVNSLEGYPSQAIGSIEVFCGGIPARYGDVLGGVVVIETKSYFDLYNNWKASHPTE